MGDHMKMNFEYFQIQKWLLQTIRSKEVDEKSGVIWPLNCLKKHIFCNFVLTSAENLCLLKQSTYMHLEGLVTHFHKMLLFIILWVFYFGDVCIWNRRILLYFCWFSIFFHILITNTPWTVARTAINQRVKWNSVMRSFRCIYVNCFNRLRFLAEVITKL